MVQGTTFVFVAAAAGALAAPVLDERKFGGGFHVPHVPHIPTNIIKHIPGAINNVVNTFAPAQGTKRDVEETLERRKGGGGAKPHHHTPRPHGSKTDIIGNGINAAGTVVDLVGAIKGNGGKRDLESELESRKVKAPHVSRPHGSKTDIIGNGINAVGTGIDLVNVIKGNGGKRSLVRRKGGAHGGSHGGSHGTHKIKRPHGSKTDIAGNLIDAAGNIIALAGLWERDLDSEFLERRKNTPKPPHKPHHTHHPGPKPSPKPSPKPKVPRPIEINPTFNPTIEIPSINIGAPGAPAPAASSAAPAPPVARDLWEEFDELD